MTLREAAELVISTFEADEKQGYRSRDREFAIAVLRKGLEEKLVRIATVEFQPPYPIVTTTHNVT